MRHNSFFIRLIFLWVCFVAVMTSAQTKSTVESDASTAKVDAYVQEKMAANHIPGLSLAVVRDGKIILAKGYGMANLELSVPATEKTNYLIASITKNFTGAAIMMLVEEGKVSLEDPISKYLSGLPEAWKVITIRQLLNHTSGIKKGIIPCEFDSDPDNYTQADFIKEFACLPLGFSPGEKWEYSGMGYFLLGMTIEKVSGKIFEQFLTERIFAPLGMKETRMINYAELVPNRANGYSWRNGAFRNSQQMNPVGEFSNGGLISTVLDMAKWDAALYTEKLLKRTTLEQMWTNAKLNNGQIVPSYGIGFGLTPFRGRKRVGHTGGIPGFSSGMSRFIDDKLTVILLTNVAHGDFNVGEMTNEIAAFYFPK